MWSTAWCLFCMSSCIFAISAVKFMVLIFIIFNELLQCQLGSSPEMIQCPVVIQSGNP
jgi:hypothetical protein